MWFLKSFKYWGYILIHPTKGFGLFEEDHQVVAMRRFQLIGGFSIFLLLNYWMFVSLLGEQLHAPIFHVGASAFIKFFGYFFAMMVIAVGGMIVKVQNANLGQVILTIFSLTMVFEWLLMFGIMIFPDFPFEVKLLVYLWRTVVTVLGLYAISSLSINQAVGVGVVANIPLYFANTSGYYDLM